MFSNTCTNCMYLNSTAQARGARVQSPKCKEKLHPQLFSNIFMNF